MTKMAGQYLKHAIVNDRVEVQKLIELHREKRGCTFQKLLFMRKTQTTTFGGKELVDN